ncbi:uncharacterized protein LOC128717933 [Anopheles marshallii]|uniref:uncharacterized protein LOC128717933 n=1 Tax=Anopheles marshallii TaxID=1521116 RepID=UPI00237C2C50|nr:uncharacterized protein LOC128717933 [Anopheles marshallii]
MFSIRGAHIFVCSEENDETLVKIKVDSNRVTIGAHPLNNIRLHTSNAERLHCKIFADSANSVIIENYSQRNPILVNGVCVESKAKLHDNDRFEMAGSTFLWSFNPEHITVVSKPTKRPNLRRKTITMKRIRSTGDITKKSFIKVPQAVGLMLDEYRKRRTIHSTMSGQFLSKNANLPDCEDVDTNAHSNLSTEAAFNITTSSELASCITPTIQKENVIPVRTKAQHNGDIKLTPQTSAAKRRHLACHTPVSNLIDLTTPSTKSRDTIVGRKRFSSQSKAVQSPRILDMINIATPSPERICRTPNSLKAAASTPKTTLLKSAIKNSRAHDQPDAKNTSIPLISMKKTPNVKLNTSRTNTPKLTPASTKTSEKVRKHLITTLSEKKGDSLLKTDSPVPIIKTGRFSKHSTPTIAKGHRTPKRGNFSVTPRIQLPVQCNSLESDNGEINVNMGNNAVDGSASAMPIIDVQSVIKKPNQTTQIRSAKYSDITPHESFADGIMPVVMSSEENVLMLQTESIPLKANIFQDELKPMNNMLTNFKSNRNSRSSTVASVTAESTSIRKTMSEFSSSLPGSPLCRFSHKLAKSNIQSEEDAITDEFEYDIDAQAKDADEHEKLTGNYSESPVQLHIVSTPELRHSWRHTRKCIGSAFTSLNTSRPQLDLTAEIDESLVFIEDEETGSDHNELYNMECSKAISGTNEQIVLHNPPVKNHRTAPIGNVSEISIVPILESSSDFSSKSSLEDITTDPGAYNNALIKRDDVTDKILESPLEEKTAYLDAHNDASIKKGNSTDNNLEARKSVHSLNLPENDEEVLKEMEVLHAVDNDPAVSTCDVLSSRIIFDYVYFSSLEEETADLDALNDASIKKDNSKDQNLEAGTSVHILNSSKTDEDVLEEKKVLHAVDNDPVLESSLDVLSRSSLEEETADLDAHNDASIKKDNSTVQNLEACTSVHSLNSSKTDEEVLEEKKVLHAVDNDPVVSTSDALLKRIIFDYVYFSFLEEEIADLDAHNVDSIKKDNSTDQNSEARRSVHSLKFPQKDEEVLEELEVLHAVDNDSAVSTCDVLPSRIIFDYVYFSSLEEETAILDALNDASIKKDNSKDQNLEAGTSVHILNSSKTDEDVLEEMEVATAADNDPVLESSLDVLSRSSLEEETADLDAHNDDSIKKDNSIDQNLEARTSMHSPNFPEYDEEVLEEKKVLHEVDNQLAVSTCDVLCSRIMFDYVYFSSFEEETADLDAHNDASIKDNSTDQNLEARTSVHILNSSKPDEEVMEEMEVVPAVDNDPVLESSLDVLSKSSLEEETADLDAHNDASIKKDNSTVQNLEACTSVHILNSSKPDEEVMEGKKVLHAVDNEPVVSTSDVLSKRIIFDYVYFSSLEEETAVLDALNDASIKKDKSTDQNLEACTSVHILNSSKTDEEVLEEMEVATAADNDPVLESSLDVLSKSSLEEETADLDAHNDASIKKDNSTDQNLEACTSVHSLNSSKPDEEVMEGKKVLRAVDNEPVVSTSDVLSKSSLEEETADLDAHNDASIKKDNSTDQNLEARTSVHSQNFPENDEEVLEEMEVAPAVDNDPVLESTSDVLYKSTFEGEMADCDVHSAMTDPASDLQQVNEDASKTNDHSTDHYPTIDSSLQSVICYEKDENLQENVASPKMQQSTPRVSKRRLYSKNILSSASLDHTKEEIPRSVSDAEYLGILTALTHKANESKKGQVGNGNTETCKNRPKRACREKIINLSEKFLSGPSPVPKFVKSKLIDQDAQHDDTFEHHDTNVVTDEETS